MWPEWPPLATGAEWAHPTHQLCKKKNTQMQSIWRRYHSTNKPVEEVSLLQPLTSPTLLSASDVCEEDRVFSQQRGRTNSSSRRASPLRNKIHVVLFFLSLKVFPSVILPSCKLPSQRKALKSEKKRMDCEGSEGETTRRRVGSERRRT